MTTPPAGVPSEHAQRQRQTVLKLCGAGLEILDGMAQAADNGDFRTVSDAAASLAKDLIDVSRVMMATDAIERTMKG